MTRADTQDESRYRLLVERSPYCIHEIDRAGRLVSMNPAGLCMMGVSDQTEIVGLDYLSAAAERDRERIGELLQRALDGEPSEFEFTAVNGRTFRSLFEPIRDEAGVVTRLMGITQDVTERRELEEQLRRAQKLESIGRLAGGIAHDFNNLLQVILGNIGLLELATPTGASTDARLSAIRRAAEQAASLTKRLLMVGRRQPLQFEMVCLNAVARGLHEVLSRTLPASISIQLEPTPSLPRTWGDPTQLEQVLLNLSLNAGHAMPDGGRLTISTGLEPPGDWVWAEVADTGTGMTTETKARAFEPFFTTRPTGEGTGLGLSVVYGIVRAHEGEVTIESAPGSGTRVRVLLPVREAHAAGVGALQRPTDDAKQRVLVAEDQPEVRQLVELILTEAGYDVVTVGDGVEALQRLESLDRVDLLLLDVVMPNLGGKEVWERVRSSGPPVVFMSGYSADGLEFEELAAHGVKLLEKPFSAGDLLTAVRKALRAPSG